MMQNSSLVMQLARNAGSESGTRKDNASWLMFDELGAMFPVNYTVDSEGKLMLMQCLRVVCMTLLLEKSSVLA
jgi:hypothetical protein